MASALRSSLLRKVCSSVTAGHTSVSRLHPRTTIPKASPLSTIFIPYLSSSATCFAKRDSATATRRAAFHTSGRKSILPAGPQVVDGTANDPAPVPTPSPTHGSYHWAFERLISAALIPLTIAPFAAGSLNPVTDAVLCATILIHSHIGFESIIIDYIPIWRFPKSRALFWWGLRAGTLVVAVGLYEFETNDVGLTEAIKRIWTA